MKCYLITEARLLLKQGSCANGTKHLEPWKYCTLTLFRWAMAGSWTLWLRLPLVTNLWLRWTGLSTMPPADTGLAQVSILSAIQPFETSA
eukprot:scaffold210103_cov15-Tisochrysis_lutea.AAC.1